MTRLITPFSMFILVHFCLSREDLEEDQRDPRPHISLASIILLIYVLIPLIVIFTLKHETICIL